MSLEESRSDLPPSLLSDLDFVCSPSLSMPTNGRLRLARNAGVFGFSFHGKVLTLTSAFLGQSSLGAEGNHPYAVRVWLNPEKSFSLAFCISAAASMSVWLRAFRTNSSIVTPAFK